MLALRDPAPWIFQDELGYAELARSFAHDGQFAIRGGDTGGFGLLYPLLISPAFMLFDGATDAYDAIRAINALLISSTAIPAYLLARLVAGRGIALVAASLSILVFSMGYANVVMTENAFYPAVTGASCAAAYALLRPTIARQLLVIALIGVAFAVRVQAIVLVPALIAAIVLFAAADAVRARSDRRRVLVRSLLQYRFSLALVALGAVLLVAVQTVRGGSWSDILSGYSPVAETNYDVGDVAHWLVYHLADLDVASGLIPFAVLLLAPFVAIRRDVPREFAAVTAVAIPVAAVFAATVSAYASLPNTARIEERNLFHVLPLFFAVFAGWLAARMPRPLVPTLVAALTAALLPTAIPFARFLDETATHSTMSLLPFFRVEQEVGVDDLVILVGVGGLAAAALLVALARPFWFLLPAVMLGYLALGTWAVEAFTHGASEGSRASALGDLPRDWIDREVPDGRSAVQLVSGTNGSAFWVNEFFNDDLGRVYNLAGSHDSFPQETLAPDRASGVLRDGRGASVEADFAQTAPGVSLRGAVAARDREIGTTLWRLDGPLALRERTTGVYGDLWSYPSFSYRRYACDRGVVVANLLSDDRLFPRGQTVTVSQGGTVLRRVSIEPDVLRAIVRVPVRPQGGACELRFDVAPSAVPAAVTGGADTRELGVRVIAIGFRPRR